MSADAPSRLLRNLRHTASWAAIGCFLVGALVLTGWFLKIDLLKAGLFPSANPIDPTTATSLLLAGASLWLLQPGRGRRVRNGAGQLLAGLVVAIGLARLLGFLLQVRIPLVERFFQDQVDAFTMIPTNAFHVFLIGAALLLIDWETRRGDRAAQYLVITPFFVAIVSLLLYSYGMETIGGAARNVPMVLPVAIALFLSCLGVLCTYPDRGVMTLVTRQDAGSAIARMMLPAALGIPALLGLLRTGGQRAGLFDAESGLTVMYISTIVVFVALVGLTAYFVNRSETGKRLAERRLATQFNTVYLLAESGAIEATLPRVLQAVGEAQGWSFGARWVAAGADALEARETWARDPARVAGFAEATRRARLAIGADVAGQAWSNAQAVRASGPSLDASARGELGRSAGFSKAVAFPVVGFQGVRSVFEFWGPAEAPDDPDTMRMYDAIGRQVGQFVERKEAQADVERAKAAAEAATQAKSTFLANMSHEIRTPMNAIIGMTQLMMGNKVDPQQREFLETIRVSGETLLHLINDLLDFSKIESGRLELENEPFFIADVIEDAISIVAQRAAEKGIEIAYSLSEETPPGVRGDPTRLRQILLNLLTNAVKFTERGTVSVVVSSQPARDANVELRFDVSDTGMGIPADRMDRLFKAFSQVDASTTRVFGGTGLGLAISKRLTELMGGRIWLESQPDHGSTFHFTLLAPPVSPPPRPEDAALAGLARRRVLVVDDNAVNRRLVRLQAQRWGMVIEEAADAEEALRQLREGAVFDAILIDYHMPRMDGMQLARQIRAMPTQARTPLLLLSSARLTGEDLTSARPYFHGILTKPVRLNQLRNAVAAALGLAATAPAPVTPEPERVPRALRILLAEDNDVNRTVAKLMLERLGYKADAVQNGLQALAAAKKEHYDVILMDVQMPEMDGLEATRRIRRDVGPALRPQIVAMTAGALEADRRRCMEAGMDDYLTKPIQLEQLAAALDRIPQRKELAQLA